SNIEPYDKEQCNEPRWLKVSRLSRFTRHCLYALVEERHRSLDAVAHHHVNGLHAAIEHCIERLDIPLWYPREHETGEIADRVIGCGAQPKPGKILRSQSLEDRLQSLLAPRAAAGSDANHPERQSDIIAEDDQVRRASF